MKHKVSLSDIGAYILLIAIAAVVYFGWDPLPAGGPPTEAAEVRSSIKPSSRPSSPKIRPGRSSIKPSSR